MTSARGSKRPRATSSPCSTRSVRSEPPSCRTAGGSRSPSRSRRRIRAGLRLSSSSTPWFGFSRPTTTRGACHSRCAGRLQAGTASRGVKGLVRGDAVIPRAGRDPLIPPRRRSTPLARTPRARRLCPRAYGGVVERVGVRCAPAAPADPSADVGDESREQRHGSRGRLGVRRVGDPGCARPRSIPSRDLELWASQPPMLADEIERFVTGSTGEHLSPAERAFAVVLYTDLVGSTSQAVEMGDRRWRELLEVHNNAAARQIERHRGRLVKRTGDGVLAVFDAPGRAVRCAQVILADVEQLGYKARAGLHAGEVELLGDDIAGIGAHIAARVMDHAGPGRSSCPARSKTSSLGRACASRTAVRIHSEAYPRSGSYSPSTRSTRTSQIGAEPRTGMSTPSSVPAAQRPARSNESTRPHIMPAGARSAACGDRTERRLAPVARACPNRRSVSRRPRALCADLVR